jgi:ABC-2 type transport system permease protein
MGGPFRAELLKSWRSWATTILIVIVALVELLLGYVLIWAILQAPDVGGDAGGFGEQGRAALLATLGPDALVGNALSMLAGLGGALALVLGALSSAREYGWRTVAALLVQGRPRPALIAAKAAALAVVLAVMTLATFLAALAGSAFVMQLEGGETGLPPMDELAAGLGAGWLIVGAWGSIGLALGFLLRGTGLAIGLGLAYAFVIETIIVSLVGSSDIVEGVSRGLVGVNAGALAGSFGPELPPQFGGSVLDIAPAVAALVLAAYLVAGLVAATVVVRARDVT